MGNHGPYLRHPPKMSATLKLTREGFGLELHRGTFDVLIDGKRAGLIEWHGEVEIPVEPGHHTLQVRKARYSSRDRTFDIADGETASFRCHGANLWPIWLAAFAIPSLGLSLSRE